MPNIGPLWSLFSQVTSLSRSDPFSGDELHHSGWNACSSCHDDSNKHRKYLILPALGSSRLYAVDCLTDPRAPRLHRTVEGAEIAEKTSGLMDVVASDLWSWLDLAFPHTSHCLADGNIMVSMMGRPMDLGTVGSCCWIRRALISRERGRKEMVSEIQRSCWLILWA